jgi:hypothetical protein
MQTYCNGSCLNSTYLYTNAFSLAYKYILTHYSNADILQRLLVWHQDPLQVVKKEVFKQVGTSLESKNLKKPHRSVHPSESSHMCIHTHTWICAHIESKNSKKLHRSVHPAGSSHTCIHTYTHTPTHMDICTHARIHMSILLNQTIHTYICR